MKKLIKRKRIRKKLFKASQGAVSLMLCILITPFLSMAGALIELSRYQSATELMQEVIDASMLSVLANYDTYLEDRFGLFAVSQDIDMSETFNSYLSENSEILGGAVSLASASVTGKYSLSTNAESGSYDVLEAQLLDFSETSVVTEMVLENFKLQELIDKLKELTGFSNVSNIASNAKTATSAIKSLVEAGETLYNDLNDIVDGIEAAITAVQETVDVFSEMYSSLQEALNFDISQYEIAYEDGTLVLKKTAQSDDEEDETIDIITELSGSEYDDYFSNIKSNVSTIISKVSSVKEKINNLPSDYQTFKEKLSEAKSAVQKLSDSSSSGSSSSSSSSSSDSSSSDTLKESAQSATSDLAQIFEDIIDDLEESLEDIKDDVLSEIKEIFTDITDVFNDEDSVIYLLKNFNKDSNYKKVLEKVVEYFKTYLTSGSSLSVDSFYEYVMENNFITDIYSKIKDIPTKLDVAVENAWQAIKEAASDAVINALKSLVNSITEMFNIDFVDSSLNAYLSDSVVDDLAEDSGPYSTFLEGLSDLIEEIGNLSSGDEESGSWWSKIKSFIESLFGIFEAVGKVLSSIMDLVSTFLSKVSDLIDAVKNPENIYDFFLLAGYMVHNLPNRLTNLSSESALTGFSYDDLPSDDTDSSSDYESSGLSGITNYLNSFDESGSGGNKVFKGAEAEYILAGTRSEIMNQLVAFMQIYMIRLLLNLPTVFTDTAVSGMASAANIFSWVVYLVVLMAEPLCDTVLLVKGADIDLIKSKCYLTPTGIASLIDEYKTLGVSKAVTDSLTSLESSISGSEFKSSNSSSDSSSSDSSSSDLFEFGYADHLLLCMVVLLPKDQLLTRFANLVQIEAKQYYSINGGSSFDIDKAYTCITCNASVTYYPFISIFESAGLSTFTVEYEQDRSY